MINLRSDTVTRPTEAMREAAAAAAVGDDVYRRDPTVNELEARAAELVGAEAALFCPSGTMANQVAARTHTDRGQEILVEVESHIYNYELGGLAQHGGLQVRSIDAGPAAVPTPEQVRAAHRAETDHAAGTGLLCIENTHNRRGGVAVAPESIDAAVEAAHELDVPVHLDGARVCNAAVALDVPVSRLTATVDSVMFCLSKGLGAPVGSMVAGDAEFVERARRNRKLLGGGMRQAGVIAAPGLLALESIDRLADDHANATALADGLRALDGLDVQAPETNIVLVDTAGAGLTAAEFVERCETAGVWASEFGEHVVRFVTHRDADADDVEAALDRIAGALA